jgi:kynureninase
VGPITDDSGWLLYHSVGRFPGQREVVGNILMASLDAWLALDDKRWQVLEGRRRRAIELWARLIGASPKEVFTAENVTLAFHAFIDSLANDRLAGRDVLVAEDCFPSIRYLLHALAPRIGFRVKTVEIAPGAAYVTDAQLIDAWDRKVALAVVNWISSVSSKRADLAALLAHGKHLGSLVAVDITQGAGIEPIDVKAISADFVASTSLKWICGVPGAGFGYVAPDLLLELNPRVQGWYSQPQPSNWTLERFTLAGDARRFGTGTASVLPYAASVPGLEWILDQGITNLRQHNVALCHRLIEIIDSHGLQLVSPREDSQRGGSLMFRLKSANDAEEARRRLLDKGLICDIRGDRMRWSPGAVTTVEAIEVLHSAIDEAIPRAAR